MKIKIHFLCFFLLVCLSFTWAQQNPTDLSGNTTPAKMGFPRKLEEAQSGNVLSMVNVGDCYRTGYYVQKNAKEAAFWYNKAIGAGNGRGWYGLGMLIKYGGETEVDFRKAFECFAKGAALGDPLSIYTHGYMLYKGLGCQQSYESAVQFFRIAAKAKIPEAQYFLGLCYRNGYGVVKNSETAKVYLRMAAFQGDKQAQFELTQKEPENIEESEQISQKILEAAKLSTANIRSLGSNEHDFNLKQSDLTGKYTGYLLTYDWSGKHIIAAAKLSIEFNSKPNGFNTVWSEEANESKSIDAKLTPQGLTFTNATFHKTDHYNKVSAKIRFDKLKLKLIQYGNNIVLSGQIDAYVDERKEPGKPQKIILVKSNAVKTNSKNLTADKSISVDELNSNKLIRVFPNPVKNELTVQFNLQNTSTVQLSIYNEEGKEIFHNNSAEFSKGTHKLKATLQLGSGIYIAKLICGPNDIRTTKIIKK